MNTTPQMYTKVSFAKLSKYLAHTASAEEVNYIEVTDIEAEALSGKHHNEPSPLGARLQASGKHVALKLPETIENLYSMQNCFYGCTDLVSVAAVPKGVMEMTCCFAFCESLTKASVFPAYVVNMCACFAGCTSLIKAPALPADITSLAFCFADCKSLTKAPAIPDSVTRIDECFRGCERLTEIPRMPKGITRAADCFLSARLEALRALLQN